MLHSRNFKPVKSLAALGALGLLAFFGACHGSNDTDGGIASDNLGTGNQPVSDGGFGASLTIELSDGDNIIHTGDREGFFVTALDPSGARFDEYFANPNEVLPFLNLRQVVWHLSTPVRMVA
jgi:hypothetical protein